MTKLHQLDKRDWPKETWAFPRIHYFTWGFGLGAEASTQASTIVPYVMQDNALVDYETIKTNPQNADFAIVGYPNTLQGSHVPKLMVYKEFYMPQGMDEIDLLRVDNMPIHTSTLNRLDASDKKTGADIEDILELTHETTDEQCYPLWNGTDLTEEGVDAYDYDALVPGLTTTQRPEGVAWDFEEFMAANKYYTNKEMLKLVTDRLESRVITNNNLPHGRPFYSKTETIDTPSLCKSQREYTFCGELFSLPQASTRRQFVLAGDITNIEHCRFRGWTYFLEYNPAMNFARA